MSSMELLALCKEYFLTFVLIVLALVVCLALIRAVLGPRFTDRVVSVNIIGTTTMMMICILGVLKNETYLFDIAIVYAMISFLAVVVLVNVLQSIHSFKNKGEEGFDEE